VAVEEERSQAMSFYLRTEHLPHAKMSTLQFGDQQNSEGHLGDDSGALQGLTLLKEMLELKIQCIAVMFVYYHTWLHLLLQGLVQ
jgi:hypothetical protein